MSQQLDFHSLLQRGLELPPEKKLYFNGYTISMTPPDFIIVLQHNDQPVAFLNTSHTVAKTLAKTILNFIEDFEGKLDQPILTLDEIAEKLKVQNATNQQHNE